MKQAIPFVRVPVGWMPCVACSDFKKEPGKMWVGYDGIGGDLFITCPSCQGKGEVVRYKHISLHTGQELNTEAPGQRFVYTGEVLDNSQRR